MTDELTARDERLALVHIDRSTRRPVLFLFASAVFWLLAGSLLALLASIKLHAPGFLDSFAFLTFGRVRPAHLNVMTYGWASMAGLGAALWLQARLSRVRLPGEPLALVVGCVWNMVVLIGTVQILRGEHTSVEWLEFPRWTSYVLSAAFVVVGMLSAIMFKARKVRHVYVSQWYLFGAVFWFPAMYFTSVQIVHGALARGVGLGTTNWWYAHNVLGLWLTPIGLASIYYLIPKVLGRPIHSYYLSLLGFWTLAIFYNWAGSHHLIGGPLPAWIVTVGIVGSMMMFVPVIAVAINHHLTMVGNFGALRQSPTLRFVVFGGMSYTLVSVQGSLTALRTLNRTTHFTHYTIAHAHLGMYAFFTMTMFGVMYYAVPRLTGREWASARLIRVHFWTTALGVALYWVGLSVGGVLQGILLNDAAVPFLDIVARLQPYLVSRSVAGVLLTIGHLTFAMLLCQQIFGQRQGAAVPTLLGKPRVA